MCAELRARFARAGFTAQLIAEVESYLPGVLRPPRLPLLRWWLSRRAGAGPLLARFFAYDDNLTDGEARDALGTELLDALVLAGIVSTVPQGGFIAHFLVTPVEEGLWVLSDRLDGNPDAVMGPGGGTQHLGSLHRSLAAGQRSISAAELAHWRSRPLAAERAAPWASISTLVPSPSRASMRA